VALKKVRFERSRCGAGGSGVVWGGAWAAGLRGAGGTASAQWPWVGANVWGWARPLLVSSAAAALAEPRDGLRSPARPPDKGALYPLPPPSAGASSEGVPVTSVRELRVLQRCRHPNIVHLEVGPTPNRQWATLWTRPWPSAPRRSALEALQSSAGADAAHPPPYAPGPASLPPSPMLPPPSLTAPHGAAPRPASPAARCHRLQARQRVPGV
jgi:hypothetical protein